MKRFAWKKVWAFLATTLTTSLTWYLIRIKRQAPLIVSTVLPRFTAHLSNESWPQLEQRICSGWGDSPVLGRWCPVTGCEGISLLLVPYRQREKHLRILIANIFDYFRSVNKPVWLIVLEQRPEETFNRGALLDAGIVISKEIVRRAGISKFCLISHDVDLIPRDERVRYSCGVKGVRHVASAQARHGFRPPYESYLGGVVAMRPSQADRLNGYSLAYWGWGGEDDDLYTRVGLAGLRLERFGRDESAFLSPWHPADPGNLPKQSRAGLIRSGGRRWRKDGLSSLKFTLQPSQSSSCLRRHFFIQFEKPL